MGTCVVRAESRPCTWRMGPRFPATVHAGGSRSTHRKHHAARGGGRGGAGNCYCAIHPGLLPEVASLPETAESPDSAIREVPLAQRGPVETDSAASCFTPSSESFCFVSRSQ